MKVVYDGVFLLQLFVGSPIVSFADGIAIVSVAKTVGEIKVKANTAKSNRT